MFVDSRRDLVRPARLMREALASCLVTFAIAILFKQPRQRTDVGSNSQNGEERELHLEGCLVEVGSK